MFNKEKWVNAVLQNDESSSDNELIQYFMENGLSASQAVKSVEQRQKCLLDRFYIVKI